MAEKKPVFKVKAILKGYYNHKIREEGDVFYIREVIDFSDVWMKCLDSKLQKLLDDKANGVAPAAVNSPAVGKIEKISFSKPAATELEPETEIESDDPDAELNDLDQEQAKGGFSTEADEPTDGTDEVI